MKSFLIARSDQVPNVEINVPNISGLIVIVKLKFTISTSLDILTKCPFDTRF